MKKCIVLDLDNTLWGGVVGEDGPENIALSLTGQGAHFTAFQQALLDLHDRGVILAINSRNNESDAHRVIRENPNMILKEKHFAASRINWNAKHQNMRELASELNIGLDSMVFLDDNPAERAEMRHFLPEVETPELPSDPAGYVSFLHSLPYFPTAALTDEDKMRGNFYVTERLRQAAEKEFPDRDSFLRSLNLRFTIHNNDRSALPRLSQLTDKTNQFNTNKKPMSESELLALIDAGTHEIIHGRLMDRFGDHGIIALALLEKRGEDWHIPSLLMSCRILSRGVEHAFLHALSKRASSEGATHLTIDVVPTEKNQPARDFVERTWVEKRLPVEEIDAPDWIEIRYEKF